jgi:hypothetical protein
MYEALVPSINIKYRRKMVVHDYMNGLKGAILIFMKLELQYQANLSQCRSKVFLLNNNVLRKL